MLLNRAHRVIRHQLHVRPVQTGQVARIQHLPLTPDEGARHQRLDIARRRGALHIRPIRAGQAVADRAARGEVEAREVALHGGVELGAVEAHGERDVAHERLEERRVGGVGAFGEEVGLAGELGEVVDRVAAGGEDGHELGGAAAVACGLEER